MQDLECYEALFLWNQIPAKNKLDSFIVTIILWAQKKYQLLLEIHG